MPVRIPQAAGRRRTRSSTAPAATATCSTSCCSTGASSAATRRAATPRCRPSRRAPRRRDPSRTMLGATQEAWTAEAFAAASATWAVLGQQTVLTDLRLPNGAILNEDQWDGYAPARDRLLAAAAPVAGRLVVLTGDIHLAGVGRLPGIGTEFVTTSVSSSGLVPAALQPMLAGFDHDRRRRAVPPRLRPPHRHAGRRGPPSTAPSTTSPAPTRPCRRGTRSPSRPARAPRSPRPDGDRSPSRSPPAARTVRPMARLGADVDAPRRARSRPRRGRRPARCHRVDR